MAAVTHPLAPRLTPVKGVSASLGAAARSDRLHFRRTAARIALLMVGDATVLVLLGALVERLRAGAWPRPLVAEALQHLLPQRALSASEFVTGVLLCLLALRTYEATDLRRDVGRFLVAAGLGVGLPCWSGLWDEFSPAALSMFLLLTWVTALFLLLERRLALKLMRQMATAGVARVLVVADADEAPRALNHPAFADPRDAVVVEVFDPEALRCDQGGLDQLCRAIRRRQADTVLLGGCPLHDGAFGTVLDAALATGCAVVAPSRLRTVAGAGPQVIWAHGAPLVALARPGVRTGQLFLKRLVDVAGALTALILLAPMMVLVAVAIRLGSRGPVIFGQTRIGEGGRPFRCLKFRSMRADAEDLLRGDPELYERYVQNDFKLPEGQDPRITSLGRVIRRTSIDELPQLWNVLRGEMSLVGPRPLVPDELNRYGDGAAVLLALKPGVSGAWAVNGRSTVAYPQRADIELTYVRNWRLGVDLSILARTVPAVFRHYGAH